MGVCLFALVVSAGCGRHVAGPTRQAKNPTVASTVPAATDLIVGMGCADHLVGICTFDPPRPETMGLPQVGDLNTVDWEAIAGNHAAVLITGLNERVRPAGFGDRAARAGVRKTVFLQVNRLADIAPAITMLGAEMNEPEKAAAAIKGLNTRLDALQRKSTGHAPVPTLLVTDAESGRVAGPGSYLDDMLIMAGGVNVVSPRETPYPTLDREELQKLRPRVIIQLLPDASPAETAKVGAVWKSMPAITAPVVVLADPYAQNPGWHVADVAEKIAKAIDGR